MDFTPHHHDTMPGALLSVTLLLFSVVLEIFSDMAGFDSKIVVPVLHFVQLSAAGMAFFVGACTMSPRLKKFVIHKFKL